jgi:hypothetical protein
MDTLYKAYQAYERRVMRGEFYGPAYQPCKPTVQQEPLQAQMGGLLIHSVRQIKTRYVTGEPVARSSKAIPSQAAFKA